MRKMSTGQKYNDGCGGGNNHEHGGSIEMRRATRGLNVGQSVRKLQERLGIGR